MEIQRIKEFIRLGEYLSYSRAAKALYISQSTLSDHIVSIEKEVGVKLVERSTSSVDLTEAGWFFFEQAQGIIEDYERLLCGCRSLKSQRKIKVLEWISAIGYGPHFEKGCEYARTRGSSFTYCVNFVSSQQSTLEELFENGSIDIGMIALPEGESPGFGAKGEYAFFFLGRERLDLYVGPNSSFLGKQSLRIEDLDGLTTPSSNLPIFDSLRSAVRETFARHGVKVVQRIVRASSLYDPLPSDGKSVLFLAPHYAGGYMKALGRDLVKLDVEGFDFVLDHYGVYRVDADDAVSEFVEEVSRAAGEVPAS